MACCSLKKISLLKLYLAEEKAIVATDIFKSKIGGRVTYTALKTTVRHILLT
jgi:hypothetical protein